MKPIKLEFRTKEEDYIELIKYLPVNRLLYRLQFILITLATLVFLCYAVYIIARDFIEGDNPFIVYSILILFTFILWFINLWIPRKIINFRIKQKALQIFNRYSHNGVSDELVEYHQDQNLFLIGKTKKEVPVDQYFDIYETKQNYLFYRNIEKTEERFLIPKGVNPDLAKMILDDLKQKEVKIVTKK